MRSIRLPAPRDDVSPRVEDQEPVRCRCREARGARRRRAGCRYREDALHRRAGDVQGGRSGLSGPCRCRGRSETGLGSLGSRDGRRRALRWCRRCLDGSKHLPGEGSDRHDAGDCPHDLRRRLARRGLSRVRPLDRLVWVGAFPHEHNEDVRSIVSAALQAGFEAIVLAEPDESLRGLGRFSPILLKGNIFYFDDAEIGRLATIRSAKDETALRSWRSTTKHIVIRTEDWKIIPLENLIAHFQGSETRLLVEVHDAAEAKLVFEAMEVGVHGILLVPSSPNEIRAVRGLLEAVREDVSLVRAAVTSIRPIGLGDRVCVDTCSLLRDGEGMLVGNSSSGLFLVHAETAETGYVAARPFRVNAGAVHAYIYLPGAKTQYLSELRAGDEVLAVDSQGAARAAIVGRGKV